MSIGYSASCAFCKRYKRQVKKLIAGKSSDGQITFICDLCIEVCYEASKKTTSPLPSLEELPTPKTIYEYLNEVVAGQDEAKRILSTAVYNHYKKVFSGEENTMKSNILLIGPTGSGKTYLMNALSKIMQVPIVIGDATQLTEAGYVGQDASDLLGNLIQVAKGDIQLAQKGIVFIDEIDKISKAQGMAGRDISGAGVQQELLTMLENTTISVTIGNKKQANQEVVQICTKNILFICAGAFPDLHSIVSKEIRSHNLAISSRSNVPAANKYDEIMQNLKHEHLVKYGMLPELLGRLPIWSVLRELTLENLIDILLHKKNSIVSQYKQLLKIRDEAELEMTDEAAIAIAKKAKPTGARGLVRLMERLLFPAMFEIPSKETKVKIIIDEEFVNKTLANVTEDTEEDTKIVTLDLMIPTMVSVKV